MELFKILIMIRFKKKKTTTFIYDYKQNNDMVINKNNLKPMI